MYVDIFWQNIVFIVVGKKLFLLFGEQGWRSGESTPLPSMWPGFSSQVWCHMWVEFVVGSLPCSKRFFSGYSGFPLSSKPTFPNSNSTRNQVDKEPLWGCATSKSLFIHLFILFLIDSRFNNALGILAYFKLVMRVRDKCTLKTSK